MALSMLGQEFGIDAHDGPQFLKQVANLQDVSRPKRRLAKRIVTGAIPLIENATQKQTEIFAKPYDRRYSEYENIEEVYSRKILATDITVPVVANRIQEPNGFVGNLNNDKRVESVDSPSVQLSHTEPMQSDEDHDMKDYLEGDAITQLNQELAADTEKTLATNTPPASMDGGKKNSDSHNGQGLVTVNSAQNPPTPPLSTQGIQSYRIGHGGIPWFAHAFDPDGITILEERWSGRELMREMSEELSEISDDELQDLGGNDFDDNFEQNQETDNASSNANSTGSQSHDRKKNSKARRRYRGFK